MAADNIPRRNKIYLNTEAELAIREAIYKVDRLPASKESTDIISDLIKILDRVSDIEDANFNK